MLALNSCVSIAYILCDVYCVVIVFFLDPKIGTYENDPLSFSGLFVFALAIK